MAVWPASLPQRQFVGLTESAAPNVIEFQVSAGPYKKRRRSTRERQFQSTPIELTGVEKATFDTFFDSTLLGGVEEFEWKNSITDATQNFRFVKKPTWTLFAPASNPNNRMYRAVLELELMD